MDDSVKMLNSYIYWIPIIYQVFYIDYHQPSPWFCNIVTPLCNISHMKFNDLPAAKSLQSCLTLCDPTDGSPPGSAIPGILQARTLEWVAISISNAQKWKK